jgi:hypothetical protein
MSGYPGFDEEQGGPYDPSEPTPSAFTKEEVIEIVAEDIANTIANEGAFDPMDPENAARDAERLIEKTAESLERERDLGEE